MALTGPGTLTCAEVEKKSFKPRRELVKKYLVNFSSEFLICAKELGLSLILRRPPGPLKNEGVKQSDSLDARCCLLFILLWTSWTFHVHAPSCVSEVFNLQKSLTRKLRLLM